MLKMIEISKWKRSVYFDWHVTSHNFVSCYTALFDCTSIYEYAKIQKVPFQVTLLHAIITGVNRFEAFRMRIINDEYLACYDRIDLITTELSTEHLYYPLYTPYVSSLTDFYRDYRKGRKRTRQSGEDVDMRNNHINSLSINLLPTIRFTQVSPNLNHYTKRGLLFLNVGKLEVDGCGKATVPVGASFSHALLDGYDFSQLINYLMYEYAKAR